MAGVQKPAETIAFVDCGNYVAAPNSAPPPAPPDDPNVNVNPPITRHNEHANVGYLDGHVKSHKWDFICRQAAGQLLPSPAASIGRRPHQIDPCCAATKEAGNPSEPPKQESKA